MRSTPTRALLTPVLVALLISLPSVLSAQNVLPKVKKPVVSTATDTGTKAPGAAIEISSFSFGASNVASTGNGNGTAPSKTDSTVINEIKPQDSTKMVSPIYKGPVLFPPSGGHPNDSAHKHPAH
jgi:hypothetical protein